MSYLNKKDKMLQRRAIGHAFAVICLLGLAALTGCGNAGEGGQKEGTGPGGAWEKHITEETVRLKGIEGEYTLLFLTDTHAIVQSQGASEQEEANEEARYPTFFNEEGVPPAEQFPEWVRYANENGVDAVLLGGDIIDTPSEANLRWLEEQLGQLDMPYLYVNGNHDWTYPWEYMTEAGKEAYLRGIYPNEDSERFVSLTTAADSPVELVLAGHVHFYDRDVIEGERQVLQLVGGAGSQGNAILVHITGGE